MDDISLRIYPVSLTAPATVTAAVTSTACDVSGYEGAAFGVHFGVSGDTLSASVYWTCKLQECATEAGSYTDVVTADIQIGSTNSFGLIDSLSEDAEIYWIGYGGSKPYVKVVVTPTGTHTYGTPIGILAFLGMPRSQTEAGKVNP